MIIAFLLLFLELGPDSISRRLKTWITHTNEAFNFHPVVVYDEIREDGSYGSNTPSDLSEYLEAEGLNKNLEPIKRKKQNEIIENAMSIDEISSAEDLELFQQAASISAIDDFFEDYSLFDVMIFKNVETFRSDTRFQRICQSKFDYFTRLTDTSFTYHVDQSQCSNDLRKNMQSLPRDIDSNDQSLRFWLSAWWRFLYDKHYSLSEYLTFGKFKKTERDMFRVLGKIGPDEFNYMYPLDFLRVHKLVAPTRWDEFAGVELLVRDIQPIA